MDYETDKHDKDNTAAASDVPVCVWLFNQSPHCGCPLLPGIIMIIIIIIVIILNLICIALVKHPNTDVEYSQNRYRTQSH